MGSDDAIIKTISILSTSNASIKLTISCSSPAAGPLHLQPSSLAFDLRSAPLKNRRSTATHSIFRFVFDDKFIPCFASLPFLSFISILRSFQEAMLVFAWEKVMNEEI